MPSTWRVHVIEERLSLEGIPAQVSECDVYALPKDERTTVVSTLIAERTSFPMVLVNGAVVSHNGVDLDAVVRAAREQLLEGDCC